eukprot:GHVU01074695.1.p1 GENE.GHVU01074695.1~~GHVU01074695.1.p1  ORF type:complete len:208 (-),score=8.97 GHVU01074695.1:193-816(-)
MCDFFLYTYTKDLLAKDSVEIERERERESLPSKEDREVPITWRTRADTNVRIKEGNHYDCGCYYPSVRYTDMDSLEIGNQLSPGWSRIHMSVWVSECTAACLLLLPPPQQQRYPQQRSPPPPIPIGDVTISRSRFRLLLLLTPRLLLLLPPLLLSGADGISPDPWPRHQECRPLRTRYVRIRRMKGRNVCMLLLLCYLCRSVLLRMR